MQAVATVRVMRSYDYCQFEIQLGVAEGESVDAIRKQAAQLADKAVAEYKLQKECEDRARTEEWSKRDLKERVERFKDKPESEWTPKEKALHKCLNDEVLADFARTLERELAALKRENETLTIERDNALLERDKTLGV